MLYIDKLTNADGVKLSLLKELEHLKICGEAEFTDLTPAGDVSLSLLKTLVVYFDVITGVGLTKYADQHPRLENLFIHRSETLADDALIANVVYSRVLKSADTALRVFRSRQVLTLLYRAHRLFRYPRVPTQLDRARRNTMRPDRPLRYLRN